jgi:hypothetical protein
MGCARLVVIGREVDTVRRRLARRAEVVGSNPRNVDAA